MIPRILLQERLWKALVPPNHHSRLEQPPNRGGYCSLSGIFPFQTESTHVQACVFPSPPPPTPPNSDIIFRMLEAVTQWKKKKKVVTELTSKSCCFQPDVN